MIRSARRNDSQNDGLPIDPDAGGPDSTGQSGDTQGLSSIAEATDESVEELSDAGQDFEAEIVSGVENAADHPEKPVPAHENDIRPPGPESD